MTELNDAPVLVVGASGGLGREIGRPLADRSARLALSGNRVALLQARRHG
jgi:NAD(P)-dependent dehydrogenase (short-subunit alcohol dehydrogenase family)